MKRKWLAFFTAAVLAFSALAACKDNNPDVSVSDTASEQESSDTAAAVSVKLDKNTYDAVEDEIFVLTATVTPARYVTWKSSDTKIATVTSNGKVIAKRAGTVTITATAEGAFDSCVVNVKAAENKPVEYVETETEHYLLSMANTDEYGEIVARYVKIEDEEKVFVDGKQFTYESADESIATVSADGKIFPTGVGTTEILVSCDGFVAYVTADVYTAGISTPEEWYSMFKNSLAWGERYFLKNDIDFSGYVYDLGVDDPSFGGEVNGNFHTVKNITEWRDKRRDDSTLDAYQAVFGTTTVGMRLKNISFENIRFTKNKCAVICQTYRTHEDNHTQHEALVSNVYIDAIYKEGGSGLFEIVMGGNVENVFMRMRKMSNANFDETFHGVTERDYLNWALGSSLFSNVVVYSENGEVSWCENPSSIGISYMNVYMCTTKQYAAYRAYTTLDTRIWEVSATEFPILRG